MYTMYLLVDFLVLCVMIQYHIMIRATLTYFSINYGATSDFFQPDMHDTSYDTSIVTTYYDITFTTLFINYRATSDFYQLGMHDISYDTSIVTSLRISYY
jgi:hypothetical protein